MDFAQTSTKQLYSSVREGEKRLGIERLRKALLLDLETIIFFNYSISSHLLVC